MQSLNITPDFSYTCTIVASKIKGTAREIYSIIITDFPCMYTGVCTPVYVQGKSPEVMPLIESDDSLHTVNSIDCRTRFVWEWFTLTECKAGPGKLASYTLLSTCSLPQIISTSLQLVTFL